MQYEIKYQPSFATIFVKLAPGESIVAEAGAMISMDGRLSMKTTFAGGLISGLLKNWFGGESLFVNKFENQTGENLEIIFSQAYIGDIVAVTLDPNSQLYLQRGAYIASTVNIKLGARWAGFASWFAGEGLFKLKVNGPGILFFGAYGGISEVMVDNEFIVDNSHLVAYTPGIKMNVGLAGGLMGSMTSGEGFVNRVKGKGKIYLQSRSVAGLVKSLATKI